MELWKQFKQQIKRHSRMSGNQLIELLQTDSEKAWDAFLKDYTEIMYMAIRAGYRANGFQADEDLILDTYRDVLNKLEANNYHYLKTYQGKSQLNTWVTSVCRNACVDRLRKESPVPKTPVEIERLSEVHQAYFKLRYIDQREERECWGLLGNIEFPLSEAEFDIVVEEVENKLTQGVREKFTTRNRNPEPIDEVAGQTVIASDESRPEDSLIATEDRELLERIADAVDICGSELSDREAMVVKLNCSNGLPSRKIAKTMNLTSAQVAKMKYKALQKLKACALRHLQQLGYRQSEIEQTIHQLGL